MRIIPALFAAASLFAITTSVVAEDYSSHLKVNGSRSGDKVTITVEGSGDWYVNTEFPMKIELNAPAGVSLDKTTLKKGDASFSGEKEGKARSATFSTGVSGESKPIGADYKVVICSSSTCSPPIKGHISIQ